LKEITSQGQKKLCKGKIMKINKSTEATGNYTGLTYERYGNRNLQVKKVPKYVNKNNLLLIINICRQQSTTQVISKVLHTVLVWPVG